MHRFSDIIRRHPVRWAVGAVAVVAGLAWLAFAYFGVHLLFVDDEVDEAVPTFDVPAAAVDVADLADDAGDVTVPEDGSAPDDGIEVTDPMDLAPGQPVVERADEASGAAAPEPSTSEAAIGSEPSTPEPSTPTEPVAGDDAAEARIVTEFEGVFESRDHPTSGRAVVLGNGTGQRFLRFEDFATDNGPDLDVYLVNSSAGGVSDVVDLGDLKGNIGDQNYEIPAEVDLETYDTVLIWCVRFSSPFGQSTLMAV